MKDKICGIYCITNLTNGKKLIGQSNDIHNRWNNHKCMLKNNKHKNPHLQSAWNKYGQEQFVFEIVLLCPVEDLDKNEIKRIADNNSTDRLFGYNVVAGGDRPKHTPESRKRISEAKMGKKLSEEQKQKRKGLFAGNKNPNYGKTISDSQKKTIAEAHRGKNHYLYGKSMSAEQKTKIGLANKGKHRSEEMKEHMRKVKKDYWDKKRQEKLMSQNTSLTSPNQTPIAESTVSLA